MATYLASSPKARWLFLHEFSRTSEQLVEDIPIYDHHYCAPTILRADEQVNYELIQLRKQGL